VISRTTRGFWKLFDALPDEVQRQAVRAYTIWRADPSHRSLQFKCISERHQAYSVRVGIHWRAIGYRESGPGEDVVTWFWIGSHADYDRLVGGL
jgi:hypothetical protein